MLLTSTDGAGIELRPTGYQFPVAPLAPPGAGGWDANWLRVHGVVRTASGEGWEFENPCLTTGEARGAARWLAAAARGEVPVTRSPGRDPTGVLGFTEPDLALSIAARAGERLVVRVHLSGEATPHAPGPPRGSTSSPPAARALSPWR